MSSGGSFQRQGLSRRHLLHVGGGLVLLTAATGCDLLSTDPDRPRRQQAARKGPESPQLRARVDSGELPPLEKRMPDNPLVVEPLERVGQYGGTLHSALLGPADSAYIWCIAEYENLLSWTSRYTGTAGTKELTPNVAESFEANPDGTEFTFQLRRGMMWSDGEPFTAADVVFGVQDVLLNEELFPVTPRILTSGEGRASIAKIDDYAFRITFPSPAGLFLQYLATWDGHTIHYFPRHYLEQFHKKYNPDIQRLVTREKAADWVELFGQICGPGAHFGENPDLPSLGAWHLSKSFAGGQRVVLQRNPYYWKTDPDGSQLPYIDEVIFDVVNTPEVMLLRSLNGDLNLEVGPDTRFTSPANKPVVAGSREKGNYRFINAVETRMNVMIIYLNFTVKDQVKREIFRNRDFRIGLSHAINRRDIIDAVMQRQGEPYQVAPIPQSPFYNKEFATQFLDYDVDKANEHLDRAFPQKDGEGRRLGPDGKPITFTIEYVAEFRPEWSDMLGIIKGQWRTVGVTLELRNIERSLYYERTDANLHEATVWHGDGGLDVLLSTGNYFPSGAGANLGPLWGTWYETGGAQGEEPPPPVRRQMELYDQLKSSGDADEQTRLMTEIMDIGREEFYLIGVVRESDKYFIASNAIHNIPDTMIQGWYYPTPGPTRPEQYFVTG